MVGKMAKRRTAYQKDVFRTIKNEKKRFFSIAIITLLGVMMFSGLIAACDDLRKSADLFFDAQNMHDLAIISTYGLTQEDLDEVGKREGVEKVEGVYEEEVRASLDSGEEKIILKTLSPSRIDDPYLLEGTYPESDDRVLILKQYADDHKLKIGDSFTVERIEQTNPAESAAGEDEDPTEDPGEYTEENKAELSQKTFTISGICYDPLEIDNPDGPVSYRATGRTNVVFVRPQVWKTDIYTSCLLTIKGAKDENCFSRAYRKSNAKVKDDINVKIRPTREKARLEEIKARAEAKLQDKKDQVYGELADAKETLEQKKALLDQQEAELRQQLDAVRVQETQFGLSLTNEKGQIQAGLDRIAQGKEELDQAATTYQENLSKADDRFQRAEEKIDSLERPIWYVRDRDAISSYTHIKSDAESIETVGSVFPVIFFIVAILISLTAITRLIEEDRGLLGTYKSIGYTNYEIIRKYTTYAFLASLIGCAGGTVCAFIGLPAFFIERIFPTMYLLPVYHYYFWPAYGLPGSVIFLLGIVFASYLSCRKAVLKPAAALLRPKSPKPGKRILLERIPFLWKRSSFLNKVTARNLFRYKKRMLMTVFGIAGCMTLLLFGFTMKDSIRDLQPRQYEKIFHYDFLALTHAEDNDKLLERVQEEEAVTDYLNVEYMPGLLSINGENIGVNFIVTDDPAKLQKLIRMPKAGETKELKLLDGSAFVTANAADVLEIETPATLTGQLADLREAHLPITDICENYLNNYVYMTADTFEIFYGSYEPNAILGSLKPTVDPVQFSEDFKGKDGVKSCVSNQEIREDFADSFILINVAVYIVILMSAILAFVVLYTLSATNISERTREIATIKVLGFYDPEVHQYINKEVVILSLMGIGAGLPLGTLLSQQMMAMMKFPSIYMTVSLHPMSYLISASLSFAFTLIVNAIMNRSLDKIDPVTALKSVE